MEAPFAVVICHGSYHTPEPFQPLLAALKAQGIEGYCPQLPTSDLRKLNVGDISRPDYDRDPPPNGYLQSAEDGEVVTEILTRLISNESKNVIVIGHSAGVFTATAAAVPNLQAKTRRAKGKAGGIVGIFYECAFLIPVSESVHSIFQPKDRSPPVIPPYCDFHLRWPAILLRVYTKSETWTDATRDWNRKTASMAWRRRRRVRNTRYSGTVC